jgi:hypothetical protein
LLSECVQSVAFLGQTRLGGSGHPGGYYPKGRL